MDLVLFAEAFVLEADTGIPLCTNLYSIIPEQHLSRPSAAVKKNLSPHRVGPLTVSYMLLHCVTARLLHGAPDHQGSVPSCADLLVQKHRRFH